MEEIALHILDIVQNSLEAEATHISLFICEDTRRDTLVICVTDNGRGMSKEVCQCVTNPFYTTRKTRRVGLGLALLESAVLACNGYVKVESELGVGTTVTAQFQHSHIDRMPLGDMAKTLTAIFLMTEACSLEYRHQVDERLFEFTTDAFREELGDIPFSNPEVREWFRQYVTEGETWVNGEANNEQTQESG